MKKSTIALLTGIVAVVLISVLSIWGMHSLGLTFKYEAPAKEAQKTEKINSTKWAVSPGAVAIKKALNSNPSGWDGRGNIMESPQTPYPFSCDTDGISPALSYAKNYGVGGKDVQVIATAYTAGLAEAGLSAKLASAKNCAPGAYAAYKLSGLTDGWQINVSTSAQRTKTTIFRYGDVVIYVVGDLNNSNVYDAAVAFKKHLAGYLNKICLSPNYDGSELDRSLFSGKYKGYYTTQTVKIKDVGLPELPADADYKAVTIGSKLTDLNSVTIPSKPTEFPVWPELPSAVEKPSAPDTPDKNAPTTKAYQSLEKDDDGPGCGWNFLGGTDPKFDTTAANEQNKKAIESTRESIKESAANWQKAVLKYWEEYSDYQKQAKKWNTYTEKVEKVRAAWDEISQEWDRYNANLRIYNNQVQARNDFLDAQKAASEQYDNDLKVCKAWNEREEKRKKEEAEASSSSASASSSEAAESSSSDASSDSDEKDKGKDKGDDEVASPTEDAATPTGSPSLDDERKADPKPDNCNPVVKPAVLSQDAPKVTAKKPTRPADPRPKK